MKTKERYMSLSIYILMQLLLLTLIKIIMVLSIRLNITKGHNSLKYLDGVKVLVCIPVEGALYLYIKFSKNIFRQY